MNIPLGKSGKFAVIDEEDLELIRAAGKWSHMPSKAGSGYASRSIWLGKDSDGLRRVGTVYMHRLTTGASDGFDVDHIDGDGLNNRRSNLRVVSHGQNQLNRTSHKGSGRIGVKRHTEQDRVIYSAKFEGKSVGHFNTEDEAIASVDAAALSARGEFARVQRPDLVGKIEPRKVCPALPTSGYRGVYKSKVPGRYTAKCNRKYLGYFQDVIEAAKAHDAEAVKAFGPKAKLNFPDR